MDHIRSLKHGGRAELGNLALACLPCNRNKGTDLGSIPTGSNQIVAFFDPRRDDWDRHFSLTSEARIEPLSAIGEVTVKILRFNDTERVIERKALLELGRYQ